MVSNFLKKKIIKPKKSKKYIFLYKTTNLINGKIYIGVHSTTNLKDGYIGCGVKSLAHARSPKNRGIASPFHNAVVKHGYNNFSMEILEYFKTINAALKREAEVVDHDFIRRNDVYNCRIGGGGGKASKPFFLYKIADEIVTLYNSGKTYTELAEKYDVSNSSIAKAIKKSSIPLISKKHPQALKDAIVVDFKNNISVPDISTKYNISPKTVRNYCTGVLRNPLSEKFVAIRPDKSYFFFSSILDFCKKEGFSDTGIYLVLNGPHTQCKGWVFFYKSKWNGELSITPPPTVTNSTGTKFVYPDGSILEVKTSLLQFSYETNTPYEGLLSLKNKHLNIYKGIKLYEENSQVPA